MTSFSQKTRFRIGLLSPTANSSGGGVFEALATHCETVRHIGFEPVVVVPEPRKGSIDFGRFGNTEIVVAERNVLGPFGLIESLYRALARSDLDIVHLHGLWLPPSVAGTCWAVRTGRPYVISPHGMLDPWIMAQGRVKKTIAKFFYEGRSWRQATSFHALTSAEASDVVSVTGRLECFVVPNAIELCSVKCARLPNVLYLGRIHPKKNLHALIDGWKMARDVLRPIGAQLTIVGWGDEKYTLDLKAKIDEVGSDDITFHGAAFGSVKTEFLASSRYLILPSLSEGLPMAVLEAWAAGTPALISQHCHLPEGIAVGAAADCGTRADTIAVSLRDAFRRDHEEWQLMSEAALGLVETRFTPNVVAAMWHEAYSKLLNEPSERRMNLQGSPMRTATGIAEDPDS